MTNIEFKELYDRALVHGWVTSKDPSVAARQKEREREYNHAYYMKHRTRAEENIAKGKDRLKDIDRLLDLMYKNGDINQYGVAQSEGALKRQIHLGNEYNKTQRHIEDNEQILKKINDTRYEAGRRSKNESNAYNNARKKERENRRNKKFHDDISKLKDSESRGMIEASRNRKGIPKKDKSIKGISQRALKKGQNIADDLWRKMTKKK